MGSSTFIATINWCSYMVLLVLYSYADIASCRLLHMTKYVNEFEKCKFYELLNRINCPKLILKPYTNNVRFSQKYNTVSGFISGVQRRLTNVGCNRL